MQESSNNIIDQDLNDLADEIKPKTSLKLLTIQDLENVLKDLSIDLQYDFFSIAFSGFAANGMILHLDWVYNNVSDNKKSSMIHAFNDQAFKVAAENLQIDTVKHLLCWVKDNRQKKEIVQMVSKILFEESLETVNDTVKEWLEIFVPKKEDREKLSLAHLDSTVLKDENGKIIKALKVLSVLDQSYQKWLSYSSDQVVKKVIVPYVDIVDFVSLVPMSVAIGNLFSEKGVKFLSKSKWKPIFTSENEIILTIAEFLSGGSGKYLKIAIPSIREALGINEDFIDLYDAKVEDLEVSGDDSGLESLD